MTKSRRICLAVITLVVVSAVSSTVAWSITKASSKSRASSHVAECIQGQLQVAIEQGGGLAGTVPATYGYTFLVVNSGAKSCVIRGYPYEILFSRSNGVIVKVSVTHQRTTLYAQPTVHRVVLRPGGTASFGVSYTYGIASTHGEPEACVTPLVDFRLPALSSHSFSYEFPIKIDVCEAGRKVSVTPVEGRSAPRR